MKGAISSRYFSAFAGLCLFVILATFTHIFTGCLDEIISSSLQDLLFGLSVAGLLFSGLFVTIVPTMDVLILRKAAYKMRYGDWDFLYWAVVGRPVLSRKVLSDPGVTFIVGMLFKKLGYQSEAQELLDRAIEKKPALDEISFSIGEVLTENDFKILTAGLEHLSKKKLILRMLLNRTTRNIAIAVGGIILLLYYAVHLIKIFIAF